MKKQNKSRLRKETNNLKNPHINIYESVVNEWYYSHLLELLFDHGSGKIEFTEDQKNKKSKEQINKIKTKRSRK